VLEAQIGRGGMGRVFRARHVRLDREVAVKLLPPELAADPAFEARFAREARAMARLSHPHVVGVHDFGTTEAGESYLVMELLPGGTLAARLPLPPGEAARVAREVLEGLAYAHGKGLVHRDIKPENVLFDAEGRAKIADFGIARLAETGSTLTHAQVVLGTPAYMPPEARAGAPPDPRMDVFAVGVLIHQMITGEPPDRAAGASAALPAALAAIVRRAMAPDPRERWASATQMLAALAAAAPELAAAPATPGPGARVAAGAAAAAATLALPPEEQSWLRAVALVLAGATAVALYAFMVSVMPRTMDPGDALPFVTFGAEVRPDGRVFTRARFETFPTLAAAGAFAVALAAYGLLRRHWRNAGLDLPDPERPLPATRAVLAIAAANTVLFVARVMIERAGFRVLWMYIPVLGGVLELGMVYYVWLAVLEARRTGRLLRREPLLWFGAAVSLLPPVVSFTRMLAGHPP
jgi:serine/threonine-protein kinase